MSFSKIVARLGQQGLRLVLLSIVIVATGVGLGLAAGYPVSRIQFEESDAVRLDQARLAGEIDPALAITAQGDLDDEAWDPGDPAVASFGLLGSDFCGEAVKVPTALSTEQSAVFTNPADESILISEAVRVDQWQSAKEYVEAVGDAVGECEQFYRSDLDGQRVQVDIKESSADAPITDYVSRRFVTSDGSSVQVWSMMAVGDVIVTTQYIGPAGPQQSLMSDLEMSILRRVAPDSFALGGVGVETSTTVAADGTGTTVIEGGAADESPGAVPDPAAEATTTTAAD